MFWKADNMNQQQAINKLRKIFQLVTIYLLKCRVQIKTKQN